MTRYHISEGDLTTAAARLDRARDHLSTLSDLSWVDVSALPPSARSRVSDATGAASSVIASVASETGAMAKDLRHRANLVHAANSGGFVYTGSIEEGRMSLLYRAGSIYKSAAAARAAGAELGGFFVTAMSDEERARWYRLMRANPDPYFRAGFDSALAAGEDSDELWEEVRRLDESYEGPILPPDAPPQWAVYVMAGRAVVDAGLTYTEQNRNVALAHERMRAQIQTATAANLYRAWITGHSSFLDNAGAALFGENNVRNEIERELDDRNLRVPESTEDAARILHGRDYDCNGSDDGPPRTFMRAARP